MNVANLQIQGLCMAVVTFQRLLVAKGVLLGPDIAHALHKAELELTGSDRAVDDLAPSDRDALAFPLRLLQAALKAPVEADFTNLATDVATTKPRYNDQM